MINDRLFYDRLDELAGGAEHGVLRATGFLTPEEQYSAVSAVRTRGCGIVSYGGAKGTERNRLFFLPDYMTGGEYGLITDISDGMREELREFIVPILVTGSGYERLLHGSFMGAILSLGLQRSAIGDIAVMDSRLAYVFCSREAAAFLCGVEQPLQRVGRDTVKVSYADLPDGFEVTREYIRVTDTIASDRLDCVVGALCSISRDRAKSAVESGDVILNYEQTDKPDAEIRDGDVLSIRGTGKFVIRGISERTKKDRIRLYADKYK